MRRSSLVIASLVALLVLAVAMPAAARRPIAIGIADPAGGDLAALDAHIAQVGHHAAALGALERLGRSRRIADLPAGPGHLRLSDGHGHGAAGTGHHPGRLVAAHRSGQSARQGVYERYKRTLNGVHDAYLTEWARAARAAGEASGKPILLRYAHEATGYWFPWSVGRFDNTKENYKAAWRYVWKIFKREGALPWVRFVWSTVFPYKWAYPGDKYVEFVGLTVLNFGANRRWRNPGPLIDKRVGASTRITKRPIIIAELATDYLGGDKAAGSSRPTRAPTRSTPRSGPSCTSTPMSRIVIAGQPDWRLVKPDDGSAVAMYQSIASRRRFQGTIR